MVLGWILVGECKKGCVEGEHLPVDGFRFQQKKSDRLEQHAYCLDLRSPLVC